jgi:hypothetical protein
MGPREVFAQLILEHTMKHFIALAIAAALFSAPATAQTKGKSATAPGIAKTTPGQQQHTTGMPAKTFAPGQLQAAPGGAMALAPGAVHRKWNCT